MDQPLTTEPLPEPRPPEPLPPMPSVFILLARALREATWRFLATFATTFRGQVAGCLLLLAPALAHPLPLYPVVQILAVLAGSAGAVVVFGGLAIRALLQPMPSASEPAATKQVSLRQALLSVPHHRAVWAALLLLCLGMAAGAVWYLVLGFGGHFTERLASALLLGLPAMALGWAVWQARTMRGH